MMAASGGHGDHHLDLHRPVPGQDRRGDQRGLARERDRPWTRPPPAGRGRGSPGARGCAPGPPRRTAWQAGAALAIARSTARRRATGPRRCARRASPRGGPARPGSRGGVAAATHDCHVEVVELVLAAVGAGGVRRRWGCRRTRRPRWPAAAAACRRRRLRPVRRACFGLGASCPSWARRPGRRGPRPGRPGPRPAAALCLPGSAKAWSWEEPRRWAPGPGTEMGAPIRELSHDVVLLTSGMRGTRREPGGAPSWRGGGAGVRSCPKPAQRGEARGRRGARTVRIVTLRRRAVSLGADEGHPPRRNGAGARRRRHRRRRRRRDRRGARPRRARRRVRTASCATWRAAPERRAAIEIITPTARRAGALVADPPRRRARAGGRGDGAVSRREDLDRAADRERLLLRLRVPARASRSPTPTSSASSRRCASTSRPTSSSCART